ncbi:hypothetical protein V491_08480, partial [Pseudogymnoascus sp. VKM F-3775]
SGIEVKERVGLFRRWSPYRNTVVAEQLARRSAKHEAEDGGAVCGAEFIDDRGPPHRLRPAHFLIESPFCRFLDTKGKTTAISIVLVKIAAYIRDVYVWRILQGYDLWRVTLSLGGMHR